MFERFTAQARDVVVRARQEARQMHHPFIGTEHLLLALLTDPPGDKPGDKASDKGGATRDIAYGVLHRAGLDASRVRAEIERLAGTPSKILSDEDAAALQTIGIDLDAVLASIEESFGPDALAQPAAMPRRERVGRWRGDGSRLTDRARKVLELALREAIRLGDRGIGTEHFLLGLLRDGSGTAAKILTDAGLALDDLRRATLAERDRAA